MSPRSRSRRGEVPLAGAHRDPSVEPGAATSDDVLDEREQRQARGRKRPGPGARVGDTAERGARRPRRVGDEAVAPVDPVDPTDGPV